MLVEAARAGDERAWTALVRRLEPGLLKAARRYGLSAAEAEDVLQTAWLRLFQHGAAIREPAAVGAWLAVIVRREAFGRVRSTSASCSRTTNRSRAGSPHRTASTRSC